MIWDGYWLFNFQWQSVDPPRVLFLNYMSNSVQNKRMTSLPVNESFIEKSIIAQLPESPQEHQKVMQMESQIGRLKEELQYYKKQAYSKSKTEPFSFRDIEKAATSVEQPAGGQYGQGDLQLRQENQQQKLIIKKLSQQLRSKKKSDYGVDLAAECQRLEYINKKLQNQNARLTTQCENLKKQLAEAKGQSQEQQGRSEVDELQRKIHEQQIKMAEMADAAVEYVKQIDALSLELEKLRRENVIDRSARKSTQNLRVEKANGQGNSRYSIINMHNSRAFSELELLDTERFNLKLSEKNKEYEQLYLKYQSIENELHAAQEINNDLQRERKFLAERLSDIEIHTEGDEIVGELENKLVLMSTELMRLGNLSRTKAQENKELNIRIKQLILKRQNLEKDVIERDKLILNYKEELRMIEIRNNERTVMESRVQKDSQIKEKNSKLVKEVQRLTLLLKEKGEALKNADIKNAILEEKHLRLEKENEELEKENKELSTSKERNKSIHTKVLNLEAEVNYFKQANSGLKDEMKRYESKFYQNRSDIDKLTREKEDARTAAQDLQEKVRSMQEELRRTQVQLEDKNMELREINHKSEEKVIFKSNEIKKLEEKVMILQKEVQRGSRIKSEMPRYEELIKEIQRLEGVQLTLKLQISTYEEKIVMLAQENQRLNLVVKTSHQDKGNADKFKYENQQKDRRIRDLQKEVESVSAREKRYKDENQNLRERLRSTMVQQRQSEGLEFKNRQLRDQIDALKTQISVKEQEIRNINERYRKESNERYTLLLRNEELNSRLGSTRTDNYGSVPSNDYYESEIKKLNNQIRLKNQKLGKFEEEARGNDEIYSTLSAEIERLNIVLEQRGREITSYKKEIDFLQHKVRTCEESLRQRNVVQIASEKSIAEAESKTKIEICEGKIRNFEGELELMRQRYQNLKRDYSAQEGKLSHALNERNILEQKANELEYQLNEKSSNFRHVEDSFKLTILQIKKSNQRLEQAMGQIQNHYIGKLEYKERECEQLRNDRKSIENQYFELEKKITNIESHYGSEIKEKNLFINNLSNNHNQTKEEIAEIKRIKAEYQVKITLLSQEIERLTEIKDKQRAEIEKLYEEIRNNENRFTTSMKESSANNQTIDVLSTEIERLNNVLVQNVQKIREYTKKSNKLQMQCSQLSKDFENAKQKNDEYQRNLNEERENNGDRLRKLEDLNKELKYQLQEKSKDCDRFLQRIQALQKKEHFETNEYMKTVAEDMRQLKEGNQKLENRLGVITREYEQLVTQLEYYKRPKSNGQSDEKMRIIGNYEATIKHMREENSILGSEKTKIQMEYDHINKIAHEFEERAKISEEKARVFEEKCRRLDERCRVLEDRLRSTQQIIKSTSNEKGQVQQKMLSAIQQMSRLQIIIKTKEAEIEKLQHALSLSKTQAQEYYSENIRDKKGIFVIKQVSEMDERSRSASGNGLQPQVRHPTNPHAIDLQHRYDLLETVNKKLSSQSESLRKKNVQYEFKMIKLKEEFDLINRLIHEYREQNDKLKENNKVLTMQLQQRTNNFMPSHSQVSSPQHSSIKGNSYIDHPYRHLSPPVHPQSPPVHPQSQPSKPNIEMRQDNVQIRAKLNQQIDRLNKINTALQNEIHDLRLSATDNVALRRRVEENLSLIVILFTEIQSLRLRVKDSDKRNVVSPIKGMV